MPPFWTTPSVANPWMRSVKEKQPKMGMENNYLMEISLLIAQSSNPAGIARAKIVVCFFIASLLSYVIDGV